MSSHLIVNSCVCICVSHPSLIPECPEFPECPPECMEDLLKRPEPLVVALLPGRRALGGGENRMNNSRPEGRISTTRNTAKIHPTGGTSFQVMYSK